MKPFYVLITIALLLSCNKKTPIETPTFLFGKWKRVNNKPDKITYEYWNEDFTGLGYTLKDKDTIFKEVLSVVSIRDTLFYKVVGVNPKPTLFKFKSQTSSSFVCENPDNEFPKKIKYTLKNDTLKARVSNPDFGIDFVFIRE